MDWLLRRDYGPTLKRMLAQQTLLLDLLYR